jgi:hypothetical protein
MQPLWMMHLEAAAEAAASRVEVQELCIQV